MSIDKVYHSFQGFEQLRAQARENSEEALPEVARQFETIFVQMMLKAMRDTIPEGGLFESDQMDFYEGMFDQQISLNISNGKGIGLAKVIERQMSRMNGSDQASASTANDDAEKALKMPQRSPFPNLTSIMLSRGINAQEGSDSGTELNSLDKDAESLKNLVSEHIKQFNPANPQAFTDELRPYARNAAIRLGVSENLLIAQAALETGWGQKVIKSEDGSSSFNLFGIKAGGGWQGDKASTSTLEYRVGIAQRERADFRVYKSLGHAFEDYADFLQSNPRYSNVLEAKTDSAYAQGLQDSGYATDPKYAEKILSVKQRLDQIMTTAQARTAQGESVRL